jgi:hypothetical protein
MKRKPGHKNRILSSAITSCKQRSDNFSSVKIFLLKALDFGVCGCENTWKIAKKRRAGRFVSERAISAEKRDSEQRVIPAAVRSNRPRGEFVDELRAGAQKCHFARTGSTPSGYWRPSGAHWTPLGAHFVAARGFINRFGAKVGRFA